MEYFYFRCKIQLDVPVVVPAYCSVCSVLTSSVLAGAAVEQRDGDAELARALPHLAFAVILKWRKIK